jgi:molybdopterin-guanine dinucleotide biosynthesis protein A
LLFEKANGHDAAIPRWDERMFEPLHAVYSRKMLPEIERAFERGKHSVLSSVFQMKDVIFVEVSGIREIDPELRTFANINTVEDLEDMIGSAVEKAKL